MFAVVEAAILATRVHLLPAATITADFDRLAVLVQKTGGPREAEAFELLRDYVRGQGSGVRGQEDAVAPHLPDP